MKSIPFSSFSHVRTSFKAQMSDTHHEMYRCSLANSVSATASCVTISPNVSSITWTSDQGNCSTSESTKTRIPNPTKQLLCTARVLERSASAESITKTESHMGTEVVCQTSVPSQVQLVAQRDSDTPKSLVSTNPSECTDVKESRTIIKQNSDVSLTTLSVSTYLIIQTDLSTLVPAKRHHYSDTSFPNQNIYELTAAAAATTPTITTTTTTTTTVGTSASETISLDPQLRTVESTRSTPLSRTEIAPPTLPKSSMHDISMQNGSGTNCKSSLPLQSSANQTLNKTVSEKGQTDSNKDSCSRQNPNKDSCTRQNPNNAVVGTDSCGTNKNDKLLVLQHGFVSSITKQLVSDLNEVSNLLRASRPGKKINSEKMALLSLREINSKFTELTPVCIRYKQLLHILKDDHSISLPDCNHFYSQERILSGCCNTLGLVFSNLKVAQQKYENVSDKRAVAIEWLIASKDALVSCLDDIKNVIDSVLAKSNIKRAIIPGEATTSLASAGAESTVRSCCADEQRKHDIKQGLKSGPVQEHVTPNAASDRHLSSADRCVNNCNSDTTTSSTSTIVCEGQTPVKQNIRLQSENTSLQLDTAAIKNTTVSNGVDEPTNDTRQVNLEASNRCPSSSVQNLEIDVSTDNCFIPTEDKSRVEERTDCDREQEKEKEERENHPDEHHPKTNEGRVEQLAGIGRESDIRGSDMERGNELKNSETEIDPIREQQKYNEDNHKCNPNSSSSTLTSNTICATFSHDTSAVSTNDTSTTAVGDDGVTKSSLSPIADKANANNSAADGESIGDVCHTHIDSGAVQTPVLIAIHSPVLSASDPRGDEYLFIARPIKKEIDEHQQQNLVISRPPHTIIFDADDYFPLQCTTADHKTSKSSSPLFKTSTKSQRTNNLTALSLICNPEKIDKMSDCEQHQSCVSHLQQESLSVCTELDDMPPLLTPDSAFGISGIVYNVKSDEPPLLEANNEELLGDVVVHGLQQFPPRSFVEQRTPDDSDICSAATNLRGSGAQFNFFCLPDTNVRGKSPAQQIVQKDASKKEFPQNEALQKETEDDSSVFDRKYAVGLRVIGELNVADGPIVDGKVGADPVGHQINLPRQIRYSENRLVNSVSCGLEVSSDNLVNDNGDEDSGDTVTMTTTTGWHLQSAERLDEDDKGRVMSEITRLNQMSSQFIHSSTSDQGVSDVDVGYNDNLRLRDEGICASLAQFVVKIEPVEEDFDPDTVSSFTDSELRPLSSDSAIATEISSKLTPISEECLGFNSSSSIDAVSSSSQQHIHDTMTPNGVELSGTPEANSRIPETYTVNPIVNSNSLSSAAVISNDQNKDGCVSTKKCESDTLLCVSNVDGNSKTISEQINVMNEYELSSEKNCTIKVTGVVESSPGLFSTEANSTVSEARPISVNRNESSKDEDDQCIRSSLKKEALTMSPSCVGDRIVYTEAPQSPPPESSYQTDALFQEHRNEETNFIHSGSRKRKLQRTFGKRNELPGIIEDEHLEVVEKKPLTNWSLKMYNSVGNKEIHESPDEFVGFWSSEKFSLAQGKRLVTATNDAQLNDGIVENTPSRDQLLSLPLKAGKDEENEKVKREAHVDESREQDLWKCVKKESLLNSIESKQHDFLNTCESWNLVESQKPDTFQRNQPGKIEKEEGLKTEENSSWLKHKRNPSEHRSLTSREDHFSRSSEHPTESKYTSSKSPEWRGKVSPHSSKGEEQGSRLSRSNSQTRSHRRSRDDRNKDMSTIRRSHEKYSGNSSSSPRYTAGSRSPVKRDGRRESRHRSRSRSPHSFHKRNPTPSKARETDTKTSRDSQSDQGRRWNVDPRRLKRHFWSDSHPRFNHGSNGPVRHSADDAKVRRSATSDDCSRFRSRYSRDILEETLQINLLASLKTENTKDGTVESESVKGKGKKGTEYAAAKQTVKKSVQSLSEGESDKRAGKCQSKVEEIEYKRNKIEEAIDKDDDDDDDDDEEEEEEMEEKKDCRSTLSSSLPKTLLRNELCQERIIVQSTPATADNNKVYQNMKATSFGASKWKEMERSGLEKNHEVTFNDMNRASAARQAIKRETTVFPEDRTLSRAALGIKQQRPVKMETLDPSGFASVRLGKTTVGYLPLKPEGSKRIQTSVGLPFRTNTSAITYKTEILQTSNFSTEVCVREYCND